MEEKGLNKFDEPRRVLEFYSGIGGMRYSLIRSGVNARVVEAFDINDTANDVYQHNFRDRPFQGNIQNLSATDLDRYGAHAWLLSPPCQPYTRQGLQKGSEDARAASFITILELIQKMMKPPLMLFVENVVGFETSDTHKIMIDVLQRSDFVTQEFILSPIQFGVPYSRPRYFLLAKRQPSSFKNSRFTNQLLHTPKVLFGHENTLSDENDHLVESCDRMIQLCEPIGRFLDVKNSSKQSGDNPLSHTTDSPVNFEEDNETSTHCITNGSDDGCLDLYSVPLSLIERWGSAMDIVYPNSKRCCCFTKSYYRYVKGTGSLLAIDPVGGAGVHRGHTVDPPLDIGEVLNLQPKHNDKASSLKEQRLRYFTPREVANLHSFPKDFQFPESISLKQCYALLGNSLSVAVVAPLLQYLFAEPA